MKKYLDLLILKWIISEREKCRGIRQDNMIAQHRILFQLGGAIFVGEFCLIIAVWLSK